MNQKRLCNRITRVPVAISVSPLLNPPRRLSKADNVKQVVQCTDIK